MDPQNNQNPTGTPVVDPNTGVQVPQAEPTMPTPSPAVPVEPVAPVVEEPVVPAMPVDPVVPVAPEPAVPAMPEPQAPAVETPITSVGDQGGVTPPPVDQPVV